MYAPTVLWEARRFFLYDFLVVLEPPHSLFCSRLTVEGCLSVVSSSPHEQLSVDAVLLPIVLRVPW